MGKKKTIFLSYRRDDIPGYGRQLQEDLQKYFGDENVFRDVEDIQGGQPWKDVLADSLAKSAALILLIGPRWEQIWRERPDKADDYIVYELNKARELGVPIIPVTINGVVLSNQLDLGPVSWLMDKQHHDISDRQNRWRTDVRDLADILSRETGLPIRKQKKEANSKKWFLIPVALVTILAVIGYLMEIVSENSQSNWSAEAPDTSLWEQNPSTGLTSDSIQKPEPYAASPDIADVAEPEPYHEYPDISGLWQADDGSLIEVSEIVDGGFTYGNGDIIGYGQFIPHLPNKFIVEVAGFGHGEYSVSTTNDKIMGWFYDNATAVTLYGTLWRVKSEF